MCEERKWEDLDTDCLINIFAKLDTKTIAESVQFVCFTWYQASQSTQCWQNLFFAYGSCSDEFVKFAIGRSKKSATCVIFEYSSDFTDQAFLCISKSCPLLKILVLPARCKIHLRSDDSLLSELVRHCKDLECIKIYGFTCRMRYPFRHTELLESISLHCKNFIDFSCPDSDIGEEEALSIVHYLPKIKVLRMKDCFLSRSSLLIILKGCSELEYADVSCCIGFDENDDEITKLAMHIKFFNSRGSALEFRGTQMVLCSD